MSVVGSRLVSPLFTYLSSMKQIQFVAAGSLLAGLLGLGSPAQAQQESRSEANSVSQRLVEDFGLISKGRLLNLSPSDAQNLATIVQRGNGNQAVANQQYTGAGGGANQAFILQVGSDNKAELAQRGSGNTTTLNQDGDGNKAISRVVGDGNTTTLNQLGNDNSYVRDVETSKVGFTLTQNGNSNVLRQTGSQVLAPPRYEVEMRGNGIQLSIHTGRIGQ